MSGRIMAFVLLTAGTLVGAIALTFAGALLSPVAQWSRRAGADGATVSALELAPDGALLIPVAMLALLSFPLFYAYSRT